MIILVVESRENPSVAKKLAYFQVAVANCDMESCAPIRGSVVYRRMLIRQKDLYRFNVAGPTSVKERRVLLYDSAHIQHEGEPRSRVQQLQIVLPMEKPFWESNSEKSGSSFRFRHMDWPLFPRRHLLERNAKRHQSKRQSRASRCLDMGLRCDLQTQRLEARVDFVDGMFGIEDAVDNALGLLSLTSDAR
jgi:hypothetical protein